MKKIKVLFLSIFVMLFFTSCVTKDAYYSGEKSLKKNKGLVLASAIANIEFGSHLFALIDIVNTRTHEEITLENRVCQVKKKDVGLLAQVFVSEEKSKDIIETSKTCGNIITGEVATGKYELKQIKVFSQSISSGMLVSRVKYIPTDKHYFTIDDSEVTYIGNVDILISKTNMLSHILGGVIGMNDQYELSKNILKKYFQKLQNSKITNSSIYLKPKEI